jgi:hypothetical protein
MENKKQMELFSPAGPGCMDNSRKMKLLYSPVCMGNTKQMKLYYPGGLKITDKWSGSWVYRQ